MTMLARRHGASPHIPEFSSYLNNASVTLPHALQTTTSSSDTWRQASSDGSSSPLIPSSRSSNNDASFFSASPGGSDISLFNSTAIKYDFEPAELIRFYLEWARPLVCGSQWPSFSLPEHIPPPWPTVIVGYALHSKLHMLSLLAYVATMMEYFGMKRINPAHTTRLIQEAIIALNSRIGSILINQIDLLYDISLLCLAAENREDYHAACTHLQTLRQVVDQAGGIQSVPRHLAEMVVNADMCIASPRLWHPSFVLPLDYDAATPSLYSMDPTLMIRAREIKRPISYDPVNEAVDDMVKCATWAVFFHSHSGSITDMDSIARKSRSITHRLLSLFTASESACRTNRRSETTRVSLLLWNKIIFAIALGPTTNIRRYLQQFKPQVVSMYKARGFAHLYAALETWNLILQDGLDDDLEDVFKQRGVIAELAEIVIELEKAGDVQMSAFMEYALKLVGSDMSQSNVYR